MPVEPPYRVSLVPAVGGGWRWHLIEAGATPRVLAYGVREYPDPEDARRAGQRVATAYVVELETE